MKTMFLFGLLSLSLIAGHSTSPDLSHLEGISDNRFLSKIAEEETNGKTCEHLCERAQVQDFEPAKVSGAGQQILVSSLVQKALKDQSQLLAIRKSDLERWNDADRIHFARWFGTTNEAARELISKRIHILIQLNEEYSVGNFRKAVPSRKGVFAFVRASDPSRIFVDTEFINASHLGENSRAGTICHEMSHFKLAGGTRDIVYGMNRCKRLARLSPAHALSNADNFEFYMEGAQ